LYILYPQVEFEGSTVLRNVENYSPNDTALHTTVPESYFINFEVEKQSSVV
jgi:hypothetical protein